MTEIEGTLDPFVEAEIKEHQRGAHSPNDRDWNYHLRPVNVVRAASLIHERDNGLRDRAAK